MKPLEPTSSVIRVTWNPFCLHSAYFVCLRDAASSIPVSWDGGLHHVDRGGIPDNNIWSLISDSNVLEEGVWSVGEFHSDTAVLGQV